MEICNDIATVCVPGKWINISYISDIYITNLQGNNTGLQKRWAGVMDGGIDLSVKIFVQGENSKLVLEAEDTPGLFFIGGK